MSKKIPQRRCVGCCKSYDKSSLFRIVRTPAGEIVTDMTGNMDCRGVYVCKSKTCIAKVRKSNAVGRALKCEIPEEIFGLVEGQVADDE